MATALTNGQAKTNRLIRHSQLYDAYPRYLTEDPTPVKLTAILRAVDQGDIGLLCGLQTEFERKSAQFHGVVQTRRNAVTALEWCIEPDPNADEDDTLAKEVADYVADRLTGIRSWPIALRHLSEAIGPNIAMIELIWENAEIAEFVLVPSTRLTTHPYTNEGLAIRTEEEHLGIPIELFPNKFIAYVPNTKGGFPFRSTLTHASVRMYLMLHHSSNDWLAFSELYGTPWRIGFYEDSVVDTDRTTAEKMLQEMGTDLAAMLPKGIKPELFQATGTGETYANQCDYADSKLAILWLGQTLTTDVGGTGSYAAAKVHDNVRGDLLASDLQAEAACIRDQLIRPMVELRYPGRDVPVPIFVRKTYAQRDVEAERLTLEQLRFARESGLRLDDDVVYDKLALPRPETPDIEVDDDAVTVTFNELTLGLERAIALGDLSLVNAMRTQLGKMLGEVLPPLTELPTKTAAPNAAEGIEDAIDDTEEK